MLGFDVMIDSAGAAHLLEVNHNPSFAIPTPLDRAIKGAVMLATLKKVIGVQHPSSLPLDPAVAPVGGDQTGVATQSDKTAAVTEPVVATAAGELLPDLQWEKVSTIGGGNASVPPAAADAATTTTPALVSRSRCPTQVLGELKEVFDLLRRHGTRSGPGTGRPAPLCIGKPGRKLLKAGLLATFGPTRKPPTNSVRPCLLPVPTTGKEI